jgi:hypothetical protein
MFMSMVGNAPSNNAHGKKTTRPSIHVKQVNHCVYVGLSRISFKVIVEEVTTAAIELSE